MKYIYIMYRATYFLTLILLLNACSEEFLELPPQTSGTVDQFYTNQSDYETAIAGVYAGFSSNVIESMNLEEYRADNLTNFAYYYNEISSNQFELNTTIRWWNLFSSIVSPANTILAGIDEVEMDEDVRNRIKGEAYFLRGYAYYTMNLWFGGVPMVTTNLSVEESYKLGRSTESEIWDLVESDLSQAVSLLPTSTDIGRADKYDAETYLAKAYMQRQKWSEAEIALEDVWSNSGASLETNWTDMWTLEAEKTSNEYMLSVVLSPAQPNNNWAAQYLFIEDNTITQGNFNYKPGYYESFEAGDLRRDETLGFSPNQLREENRKYDFGLDLTDLRYIGDIVVIRFADVQLLYAEAISMAANAPQQRSLDLINDTRNRAGLTDLTLTDVPSLNAFVEVLLAERRSELAFEGHRYSDLKRHNLLVEKVNAIGSEYNFDDTYNYVPIPQAEIDKVGSDVLLQNPGY
ncbi:RagB/SusD family nutrient uptake outer membrane protein [Arenibacter sp. F26102]|uniref:RagB/SusD family nutrient uptake outer membrane protein n=1 Tax=Arenibacter sp. F26102 TaxID=2926416 RepID=UPI001FF0E59C|nr:RagB/SusD family nutrient uptake outer membrane protein [Arenibacter sp. F26102]MCK0147280.1 RagB/SusD family nutrient uptake outer membrane protein [Arenibacter sp. F26102]